MVKSIIKNMQEKTMKESEDMSMIPKKLKSRDMVGMKVKTTRTIRNRAGACVPVGTVVKIANFGRCFDISTEKCPHCGLSAYIGGITREDVELIDDQETSDENGRLTNAGTKEAKQNVTMQEIVNKLAKYEDLEEQGRLLKLPCAVGDTVYQHMIVGIDKEKRKPIYEIFEAIVFKYSFSSFGLCFWTETIDNGKHQNEVPLSAFNETVFLTRQAAEEKLVELEGKLPLANNTGVSKGIAESE